MLFLLSLLSSNFISNAVLTLDGLAIKCNLGEKYIKRLLKLALSKTKNMRIKKQGCM
jgi:hypothetical protein